jgi:hypothetical protein
MEETERMARKRVTTTQEESRTPCYTCGQPLIIGAVFKWRYIDDCAVPVHENCWREPTEAITLWPFKDAPPEYRALSPHGGDEDWLAFVPALLVRDHGFTIGLELMLERSGVCDTSQHDLPDGSRVYIGAHS